MKGEQKKRVETRFSAICRPALALCVLLRSISFSLFPMAAVDGRVVEGEDAVRGRVLLAATPAAPGDILLREAPLACAQVGTMKKHSKSNTNPRNGIRQHSKEKDV